MTTLAHVTPADLVTFALMAAAYALICLAATRGGREIRSGDPHGQARQARAQGQGAGEGW